MGNKLVTILGIESSCDETAAAILQNGKILANIVAGQAVHASYGGVVPELASRAHQANIVPVVDAAIKAADIGIENLSALAYTRGPGLMGSLLVGSSFAKSFALARQLPLIQVNHMHAHVLAHLIDTKPEFPFICLTVSGGHTQLLKVNAPLELEILGETIDDAAGEAFDKAAKILGLPYPGGPLIDRYAALGDPKAFSFPLPNVPGLDFSFSGVKTSFLYFIQKMTKAEIELNMNDICASYQALIVEVLMQKLAKAVAATGIKNVALAGGVSANSGLRKRLQEISKEKHWNFYIPAFEYCTDNAAMIAVTGYYKYLAGQWGNQQDVSLPRYTIGS